jgi:hypothetical protein
VHPCGALRVQGAEAKRSLLKVILRQFSVLVLLSSMEAEAVLSSDRLSGAEEATILQPRGLKRGLV